MTILASATAKAGTIATDAAIEQHRRAIRLNPRNAKAHAMLGLALQERGQLEQAVASQRRALTLDPSLTSLYSVMAPALHVLGENEAAADSYRRALAQQPNDAELHKGLSGVLRALGQGAAAVASAQKAVALCPDDLGIQLELAAAQNLMRDFAATADSLERALAIEPGHLAARYDLGLTFLNLHRYAQAEACFREIINSRPDHFAAHTGLAASLRSQKRTADALASYDRALELMPDDAVAIRDKGITLHELDQTEAALDALHRSLALNPGDAQTLTSLLIVYSTIGDMERALEYGRRAMEAAPDVPIVHSNMLFVLSHCCNDAAELTREHLRFGDRWEQAYRASPAVHPNDRDPSRLIKVGFVSGDLYNHAVAHFIEPVLEALQHSSQLMLHAYYNGIVEDEVTQRLRSYMASWRNIEGRPDDEVEARIRADGIDILIDLSGHSSNNRLALFARKPAPVQASWIGYAGTTGLRTIDYYLSDQFHLPEGRYDDQFSEKIVRLPLGAPFLPEINSPPVNELPALRNGYLTFGSFHRVNKLSREVIALWAQLLRGVPDSRMVLGGLKPGGEITLLQWFADEGIDRSRLILRERTHVHGFLEQHHEVDVCLSPFPYSGSTTMLHALWMGVPTLATIGPTNPSHSAVFALAHLGLSSFIAGDAASYVQLGKFLSENPKELAALRASMRQRFTSSVLGYPGVAAAGLEHGLRQMWQRWCADLPAEPIRVRLSDLIPAEDPQAAN
jgi:predicted O-linked N-acetylglucosamine transferase (SPINDLY family)